MNIRDLAFRFLPALLLLAFTLSFVVTSFDYKADTRAMPLVIAVLTVVLLVLELLAQRRDRIGEVLRRFFTGKSHLPVGTPGKTPSVGREIGAVLWVVAFLVLAILVGFYIAIPVYVFAYLAIYVRKPPLISAITALGIVALLYVLFEVLLSYPIFSGVLFGGYM
ncbi:tripartite tricarboxylate transporter TctB family protein [Radicibacter daui]|uniref:tripartite tricarboxylate transporter TctB family protein n=1 Tax=Radicibacter daui TaxID=3064829 RepID=UPI0040468F30